MVQRVLIVGAGIGGLAAALACRRIGWQADVFERSPVLSEVGAGIQLGPNVTKILHGWGLQAALEGVAAYPQHLRVRHAHSGAVLASLSLSSMTQRYGAPYACVHRADLHGLLLAAGLPSDAAGQVHLNGLVQHWAATDQSVFLQAGLMPPAQGDVLVGADGLWSTLRVQWLRDAPPRATGHVAYRALVPQSHLPQQMRSQDVTLWLGPQLHMVQYPVRGGAWLNVVVVMESPFCGDAQSWDHPAQADALRLALARAGHAVRDVVQAIPDWRAWPLHDRAPMPGAHAQAQGRLALLGDAAHPMLPYLAQGAGMAIEDAAALADALRLCPHDVPQALHLYAQRRWQRNARVQTQARRNGHIFHARGALAWVRNLSLRLLGARLLDLSWLYRGA